MASYVYCFTRAAHPLPLDGLRGVGTEETALRAVRHESLAAVVGDAPDGLRPKRRDLVAHETVLEALCGSGAVVPMRFGTVAPDDDAVVAELARGAGRYTELLTRLDGHVERNVKGAHHEDAVLDDLLTDSPELRARNEALRAAGGRAASRNGRRSASRWPSPSNSDAPATPRTWWPPCGRSRCRTGTLRRSRAVSSTCRS